MKDNQHVSGRLAARGGLCLALLIIAVSAAMLVAQGEGVLTLGEGQQPSIDASASTGAAVWAEDDGDGLGVVAQFLGGMPIGTPFRLNDAVSGDQMNPDIAYRDDSSFFAAWQHSTSHGDELRGRFIDAAGMPIGTVFRLDNTVAGRYPAVDSDPSGRVVVAWSGTLFWPTAPSFFFRPYVRLFDPTGMPIGTTFQLGSLPGKDTPDVAMRPDGSYLVVWEDSIFKRIRAVTFDPAGMPIGTIFQVSEFEPAVRHADPAVAVDNNGDFLVVWERREAPFGRHATNNRTVQARRFDLLGMPIGTQIRIDLDAFDEPGTPAVAVDQDGNIVVSWLDVDKNANEEKLLARLVHIGMPIGSTIRIDQPGADAPRSPAIAAQTDGDFPVVWQETNGVTEIYFDELAVNENATAIVNPNL
ncbi:MAG: hypothetical protein AAGD38_20865 [Acidobacteriota bacterium]